MWSSTRSERIKQNIYHYYYYYRSHPMTALKIEDVKNVVTAGLELKADASELVTANETIVLQAAEIKTLNDEFAEIKELTANIEAKQKETIISEKKTMSQSFDIKEANITLKSALATAIDNGKKVDLKALTISGDGNGQLAIDEELGRTITERARENVAILGLIASKSVGSVEYREMVLVNFPTTDKVGEQTSTANPVANWEQTGTQGYENLAMVVAKQYAKPQISNEAIADPQIDIFSHLQSLLAEELSRYWAQQVLFGSGATNQLRGILGAMRFDDTATTGESFKETFGATPRPIDFYPTIASGAAGSLGDTDPTAVGSAIDNVIDLTAKLPSTYLNGSVYVMNRFTLAEYRKLKDLEGRALISFEAGSFNLAGYPVVLEDYMPTVAGVNASGVTINAPVIFGKLDQAFALCSIDENFLVDPYSADGAVVLKTTVRKGDIVQKNDAIVILSTKG